MLRDSLISCGASPRSAGQVGRASGQLEAVLEQAQLPGKAGWADWLEGLKPWGGLCLLTAPVQFLKSARCPSELLAPLPFLAGAHKRELLQRLSRRNIAVAEPQAQLSRWRWGWLARARRLLAVLPASEQQLRLGLQFTVCFLAVMFLQIVDASYEALRGRPIWAVSARHPSQLMLLCIVRLPLSAMFPQHAKPPAMPACR